MPVILHFGKDRSLLSSRGLILQRTGVPVECCEDLPKVDALLNRRTRGLLVLCHSSTQADRAEMLSRVQSQPGLKSLLVARNAFESYLMTGEIETLSPLAGPQGLVKRAAALL